LRVPPQVDSHSEEHLSHMRAGSARWTLSAEKSAALGNESCECSPLSNVEVLASPRQKEKG
jgi:hypothetical protein